MPLHVAEFAQVRAAKRHEPADILNPRGRCAEAGIMEFRGVVPIAEWRDGTAQGAAGRLSGDDERSAPGVRLEHPGARLEHPGARLEHPGARLDRATAGLTRARVLAITDRCWKCRAKVRGVVGVLIDAPEGPTFVSFTEIAEALASAADPRAFAARGIGRLCHRDSPGIQGGYVSNGCLECDELVGRILLDDLLDEHLRNGGTYSQLDTGLAVQLPSPVAQPALRRSA
jgi:hypothetical protein